MSKATVLVVGGGGREHALAWKLAQSERVGRVLVAPGNAGTANEPGCENVNISADDLDGLLSLARAEQVDLTVIGPEAPLAAGIADRFADAGLRCFGPRKAAAQLEASKAYAKDFFARHQIPTADYGVFTEVEPAVAHVHRTGAPIVVKADGLAAGKGVVVAQTVDQAEAAVRDMLEGDAFGSAGHRVVVEECLIGEEASFIVMAAGGVAVEFASSQDHKAAHDGDTGPNTGGMGAYSPAPVVTDAVRERVMREVIEPTLRGFEADGTPFTGFLYAGLMIDARGAARVLEFNCRLGDPETQPLLMRLQSDLFALLSAAVDEDLAMIKTQWDERSALGVVLAADGYPGSYVKGAVIQGLDQPSQEATKVFHAGTQVSDGQVVTSGGRVLCVTALGENIAQAQSVAYQAVDTVHWPGMQYRRDIGYRAVARQQSS